MFDLQLDRVTDWITSSGYTSVAIQLPEGLKSKALEISDIIISETNADVVIIGDPCYGACDLRKDNAQALVHFGHSRIPSQNDGGNVLYIEARADVDVEDVTEIVERLPQKIGLVATIQYVGLIPKMKELLESEGKKVFVSAGDKRIAYPGQVLGCNCSSAESVSNEADALLFIGEGDFHPLAAAFGIDKEMIIWNPLTKELRNVDDVRDRILRKRFAAIENASDAETFLIIVCSKSGQRRENVSKDVAKKIKNAGKRYYVVVMDEISPERLIHYSVDAYVNTACPRIAMDDSVRYKKPMLTPTELDIVLGLKEWNEYVFDAIRP